MFGLQAIPRDARFHDTAFGDLDAQAAQLRAVVAAPGFGEIADGALALAEVLRRGPTEDDCEDAATILEYLVGLIDAQRRLSA